MSGNRPSMEELLERYVEHLERTGERLSAEALCGDRPELRERLAEHLRVLEEVDAALSGEGPPAPSAPEDALPRFPGFRTVERIGSGGMGEVYKLEDLRLGRTVAAKVLKVEGLAPGYGRFLDEARDDDWIVQARRLSVSQISLYLGAFLLFCGSLFYFAAHRVHGAVEGIWHPLLVLALPFAALTVGGVVLDRRDLRGVAIAFYLGGAVLLPVLLLVLFHEAGWWIATDGQFFEDGVVSNRQLQVATVLATAWTLALALRTRTVALSSIFTGLLLVATLAVTTDLGLRGWLEEGRWDLLAFHLAPLLVVGTLLGIAAERRGAPCLATPLYFGAAGLFVLVLELVALDGRAFGHLGISLAGLQPEGVEDPSLLDTLGAMTVNGLLVYGTAIALDRWGTELGKKPARMLVILSPFLILEPIAYLSQTAEYSTVFDWSHLTLALLVTFASRFRQRKSFYYAGLLNTGLALLLIADRYDWLEAPAWAVAVVSAALLALLAGLGLTLVERTRRRNRRG